MTKTSVFLNAAVAYAAERYKVFPLEEQGKAPRISTRDGGRGCHDGTTNKTQIEQWWTRYPNANVGIHCEGFFVLDVDSDKGGSESLAQLIKTYGELPNTLTQTTGSGGKHFLYKSPQGVFISNRAGVLPGLDTRAYGGYIAVEPSVHENGNTYRWDNKGTPIADAPDWLIALVKDTKKAAFKAAERSDTGRRDIDDASLAGYLLNGGLDEEEIFAVLEKRNNNPAKRDVALPTNELWKTVRSIAKRDVRTPAGLRQAIHENALRVQAEKAVTRLVVDPSWEEYLVRDGDGKAKAILANAESALINAPVFANCLAFDELQAEVVLTRNIVDPINSKPVGHLLAGTVVNEHIVREMLILAQRLITSVCLNEPLMGAAIETVARHRAFHPIQDYLHGLTWDETPRINTWLIDHFGVENDARGYARGIGRRWLISAVSRALKPGCKADCMLVLEGKTGIGKSPALATLAGKEWFKDSPLDFRSKDRFSALKGVWIYELAEYDQYKGNDAAAIKSYLSSSYDTYRPAYGKSDVKQPRGLVFAATTNADKYLVDTTGNKRFWPVYCANHTRTNPINLQRLEDTRDQLWAEAVRAYYNGEAGFVDLPDLMSAHEHETMQRLDCDPWEDEVISYMKSKKMAKTSDILFEAVQVPPRYQSNKEQARIKEILTKHGYEYKSMRVNGQVKTVWRANEYQKSLME